MAIKTIILEIDVEEGDDTAVKELLAYLAYTKRIKKYLWREKEAVSYAQSQAAGKIAPTDKQQPAAGTGAEAASAKAPVPKPAEPQKVSAPHVVAALSEQLGQWKKQDKLIRLKALKGKGKMIDIACKIVSQDDTTGIVTVYDVDRKVVETVRMTEIEDIHLAL